MKRMRNGRLSGEDQLFRYHSYNLHYACFDCRKMFNQAPWVRRIDRSKARSEITVPCPQCGQPMRNMGKEFKPPRRNNVQQWRKIKLLYHRGYRWETAFEQIWSVERGIKVGRTVPVRFSPRASTLREARTE
jgi:DNA-directed RNA polymerase subunit RPC12/RpoP